MLQALLSGILLGLAAGVTPGPLQALVISRSAQSGWRQGVLVAVAPLITDAVIIAATVWLFSHVPGVILRLMTLVGSLMIAYIAYDTWRAQARAATAATAAKPNSAALTVARSTPFTPGAGDQAGAIYAAGSAAAAQEPVIEATPHQRSLLQAVFLNIVNPHAWMFWVIVGSPIIVRDAHLSVWNAAAFIIFFYLLLVGSKVVLAVGVDKGLKSVGRNGNVWVLRGTAVALAALSVLMFVSAIVQLLQK
ncbi:LysE family translocator [Alicyclobacillus sp. ALC3]|uniref:LysE family translocator n=1 Tax=Alicyclobacillus sp. ALC3 TaxID=2796143 RepID=UPI002379B698|nr:LysE family transporter [Alicyclobacillus sp. ALC3]WDL97535.1 LysE family transporter [Alicyclobacillus sp. ALC3]